MAIFYGLIWAKADRLFIYESCYTCYIYIGLKPRHPRRRLKLVGVLLDQVWFQRIFPPFFSPWLCKHRGFLSSNAKLRRLKSSRLFHFQGSEKGAWQQYAFSKRGFSSVWMTNNGFDLLSLTARYLQIYLLESHFSWHSHLACFSGAHM